MKATRLGTFLTPVLGRLMISPGVVLPWLRCSVSLLNNPLWLCSFPSSLGLFTTKQSSLPNNTGIKTERFFKGLALSRLFRLALLDEDIAECWQANSWTANPDGDTAIDNILQGLHSPAPQALFVIERALRQCRIIDKSNSDVHKDASIRSTLEACQYLVKNHFRLCYVKDSQVRMCHRPGVDWSVVEGEETPPEGWEVVSQSDDDDNTYQSASQIASEILSIVADSSEAQQPIDESILERLQMELQARLELTLGTDIRGRTSADTAFALCLAGITDETIYNRLALISKLEMARVSKRSSRRARDVLHVVEKLAAAGLRGPAVQDVYNVASRSVALSDAKYDKLRMVLTEQPILFNLLSTRPLLWLWRFSARQSKAKVEKSAHQNDILHTADTSPEKLEWLSAFKDPTKPLVVDVGCGLGVSLIGLASLRQRIAAKNDEVEQQIGIDWDDCNYLGGDLSLLGIRFGKGIATRWELQDHLQFTLASAEYLIDQVNQFYPGRTALVMIQFPSPYRLKKSGNSQLPSTAESGFMVSTTLMQRVAELVKRSKGSVLLQSNCEDVAVTMRDMAKRVGLSAVPASESVLSITDMPPHHRTPQRIQEWIRLGGERALGAEWSLVPLLPKGCATETEASCEVEKAPVHRCLMRPSSN